MNISAGIVITYHNSDQKSRCTFYWSTTLKFLWLNSRKYQVAYPCFLYGLRSHLMCPSNSVLNFSFSCSKTQTETTQLKQRTIENTKLRPFTEATAQHTWLIKMLLMSKWWQIHLIKYFRPCWVLITQESLGRGAQHRQPDFLLVFHWETNRDCEMCKQERKRHASIHG